MAEGWLASLAAGRVVALSAGTRPKGIHPGAVRAMAEVGVDLSGQRSESIDEHVASPPDLVLAVCTNAAEGCPTLPGARVVRWPFPDPDAATGTDAQVRAVFHEVRDAIRARLEAWIGTWTDGVPAVTDLVATAERLADSERPA